MPNFLQRCIYTFSAATPLCIIFAIVWGIQKKTLVVPIICVVVSAILVISFTASFSYFKKNLPPIAIRINNFSAHDAWFVTYLISYMLPFASIVLKGFSLILAATIAFAIIVVAPFVNSAIPNPLLFCKHYHFYCVDIENGMSGCVLISKRKLRNKREIKYVNRIFEFLLLDKEQ